MITNFKIFENISKLPKVGDYVIINNNFFPYDNSIIFKIENIEKEHGGESLVYTFTTVEVGEKERDLLSNTFRTYRNYKFDCWSDNKEELEIYINAKKYNL
jgi:hypothetical protein